LGPLSDWLPFVAYGVVGVASLVTYYLARKKNPDARNFVILGTGISVVELVTFSLFLVQTSVLIQRFVRFVGGDIGFCCLTFHPLCSSTSFIFYGSLAAMLLPMGVNMYLMLSLLASEIKRFPSTFLLIRFISLFPKYPFQFIDVLTVLMGSSNG